MDRHFAPFLVPIVAFLIPIVAIISKAVTQQQDRRLAAQERLALIARGMPLPEIDKLTVAREVGVDPLRSLNTSRRSGVVLIATGIGVILFFIAISIVVGQRHVLAGAACGLIPLAIGVGFMIDYNLQKRELSRFGMELPPDPPPSR
jgi:Flp pilus assembly protein TadB